MNEMPNNLTIVAMKAALASNQVSPTELTKAHLNRITAVDGKLRAFVHVLSDQAMEDAKSLEAISDWKQLPLGGIPVTIKDSLDLAGLPTWAGSKLRAGHMATADSAVAARLSAAGAIILGKTNCPELLMNYETDNFITGRTANPWNLERSAGGSSGGEAAAIASFCSAGGVGSDAGGSIRVPAHFCGIAGLKPTNGRISAAGHFPECIHPGGMLGVVGPMARTAADVKLLYDVLAGHDDNDPFSAPVPNIAADLGGLRVGIWEQFYEVPVLNSVQQAVRNAGEALASAGIAVCEFSPKGMERAPNLWNFFFAGLSEPFLRKMYEGVAAQPHWTFQEFWGAEGPQFTASDVVERMGQRDHLRASFLEQMREVPVLISPVMSVPAFRPREREWTVNGKKIKLFHSTMCTTPINLFGFPAMVIPYGFAEDGMPIGIQIVGKPWQEPLILAVAMLLEQLRGPFPVCPL